MDFDRTKNAKRIIVTSLIVKLLQVLLPFITRTIIIYYLGNLYLGLSSLFSSILNTLSLAELGIGSAMVFSMYKPVAEGDTKQVSSLLNLYKKIYCVIGLTIIVLGIIVLPFVPKLINGDYPNDINLYVLYLMQLFSSAVGYFFLAYKGSVLTVYQRTDVTNYVILITDVIASILQIIILIKFKNYYFFVTVQIVKNIIFNLIIARIVNKKYPNIKAKGNVNIQIKREIFKKTFALTGHKIASVVVNSTDNLFISMFIGLNMVAMYNNYYYIVTAVSSVLLICVLNLNPIIGNYLLKENNVKINRLFDVLNYINSYVVAICSSCFMCMFQPFISFWVGEKNLLPMYMVVLFVIYFYVLRIRTILMMFQDSAGIWEKDVLKAYIMTIINLVVDVVLIKKIGVASALISTIVSMVFAFVYEAIVVYKYILKGSFVIFSLKNIIYLILTAVGCFLSYTLTNALCIENNYIVNIILGFIISVACTSLVFVLATRKSKIYSYTKEFIIEKVR